MLEQLSNIFAELDADVLTRQTTWALERREALAALCKELVPTRRAMGEHAYYAKLFAVCGGKTWYNIIDGRSADGLREVVAKNVRAVADARNAKIVAKLAKAGVTSILSSDYAHSNDGFNGRFAVATDAGTKYVTINTIVAGGYNIQCLHQRTLVKI